MFSIKSVYKVLCWLLKKPVLSQEELKNIYNRAHEDNSLNYLIAGCCWIFLNLFFISIWVILCLYLFGFFSGSGNPLNVSWLQSGNSPIIQVVGIVLILISIFSGFFSGSLFWFYIMKNINLINDASIELIIRNGPFIRKKRLPDPDLTG